MKRFFMIGTYDICTLTPAGQKRLTDIAKLFKKYGERVQKSVFEFKINEVQLLKLEQEMLKIINEDSDTVRFYRLTEPHNAYIKNFGKSNPNTDYDNPLIW